VDAQVEGGAALLARLGFVWHQGEAIPRDKVPPERNDRINAAIQEGRVLVGMTDAQVRASLGGEPSSIVRIASQGGASELWHYPGQRLTLHLTRGRQQTQLAVKQIMELEASPVKPAARPGGKGQ
jgi:hypothetical protein